MQAGENSTRQVYKNVVVWDSNKTKALVCDVILNDGYIESVAAGGTTSCCADFDGQGKVAMLPGFVNSHGHAAMTLLRGLGEELPLMAWLTERVWPIENKLNGDIIKTGTTCAIMEMLSTGTTCFADMYFFMDKVADAAIEAGMRCALSRGITADKDGAKLKENLELAANYNGYNGLVRIQLGPHAPYTLSFDRMVAVAEAAQANSLGVHLHWLETEQEWTISGFEGKMTPERYLTKTGLSDVSNLLLAHCVWIKESEIKFYDKDNITIAHNPKSNLKLGSGVARLSSYLKEGVAVSLGTDGAASNNRLDMWDEMRFAALLHKGVNNDPTCVTSQEVFRMATVNGARAAGFYNTGLIEEGYSADFMLIDLDKPHYVGWNMDNLPGYIVYAGSSSDIISTAAAGRVLYQKGEFKTIDSEKVLKEARTAREYLINS